MQNWGTLFREHCKKYNERNIRALARADALNNIPPVEGSNPAPFEMELVHSYKAFSQ